MVDIVWFSTSSGNTDRFVESLKFELTFDGSWYKINKNIKETLEVSTPYILICPTYADGNGNGSVPKQVTEFLKNKQNRTNLKAVVGCGNKNFGKFFANSANVLSREHFVPILHKVELAGTPDDIRIIKEKIERL